MNTGVIRAIARARILVEVAIDIDRTWIGRTIRFEIDAARPIAPRIDTPRVYRIALDGEPDNFHAAAYDANFFDSSTAAIAALDRIFGPEHPRWIVVAVPIAKLTPRDRRLARECGVSIPEEYLP